MTTEASAYKTRDMTKPDPYYGYSGGSVALHWLSAIIVLAMALSGGAAHVVMGIVFAIVLIGRVIWRWSRGFPRVSDQPIVLNFIERLAKITILVTLLILTITGPAIVLTDTGRFAVFGLNNSPVSIPANDFARMLIAATHDMAAFALYGSIAVHLLAAVKHIVTRHDGILLRIVKPVAGGK